MRISPACFGLMCLFLQSNSDDSLMNTIPTYTIYIEPMRILGNYCLGFNETSWDLLVSRMDAHITCMFLFDDFCITYSAYFVFTPLLFKCWEYFNEPLEECVSDCDNV